MGNMNRLVTPILNSPPLLNIYLKIKPIKIILYAN